MRPIKKWCVFTVSDLLQAFNELLHSRPALLAGANPVLSSPGQAGFIADHNDGTVTKILFRHPFQESADEALNNELASLRLLLPLSRNLRIPALVSDVTFLDDSKDFFAAYRMTKIDGHCADWKFFATNSSPAAVEKHFRGLGEIVAQFHRATNELPDEWACHHTIDRGGKASPIHGFSDEMNEAILIADQYIKDNKQRGVIHGDLHAGNVMVDAKGSINGLVDFSMTGPSLNYLTDFNNIPDTNLPDFIRGYEDVSGTAIDPLMMTMTGIGLWTTQLKYYGHMPDRRRESLAELNRHLNDARDVTGYTPPSFR